MQHSDTTLTSSDGLTLYQQTWQGDGPPKAVVSIVHGLGEHSSRYHHVAEALVADDFAVCAIDHRGHGRSDGPRAHVDRYRDFMDDLGIHVADITERFPGLPIGMLGHSMGGNLAVGYALDHQDDLAALMLSGPALKAGDDLSPMMIRAFKVIARVAPKLRPQALDASLISRDPDVVAAYRADPLVYSGKISAGLGAALMHAMDTFPARYPELRLPVLVMHGTEDQLTNIDGSKELAAGAVHADVTTHFYDGLYHEIFNEPERDQVLADLRSWARTTLIG